jgi:hypothetical protein
MATTYGLVRLFLSFSAISTQAALLAFLLFIFWGPFAQAQNFSSPDQSQSTLPLFSSFFQKHTFSDFSLSQFPQQPFYMFPILLNAKLKESTPPE